MLNGTLDDFALSDVFRLLAASQRTGRLNIERPAGSGHVLMSQGKVVYAETTLSTSFLGQKLVAAGALTETQLRTALDEHGESGVRLGEIVVGAGLVDQKDLDAALLEQVLDAAFELLQWETGDFAWDSSEPTDPDVEAAFTVDELLEEVSRRFEEVEELKKRVPSTGAVPVMAPRPPEGVEAITMSPTEWQTLVFVNGSRSVAEIAEAMGRPEIDTMRTLSSLVSESLVEMTVPGAEPSGGEGVAEQTATEAPATQVVEEPEPEPEVVDMADRAEPEREEPEPEVVDVAKDEEPAAEETPSEVAAAGEETASDEWFTDPSDARDPMSTGEPSDVDLDDVEITVDTITQADGPPAEEPSVAFPKVDRAAAARELAGLSAEESKRGKSADASGDDEEDGGKGIFSRLRGGSR